MEYIITSLLAEFRVKILRNGSYLLRRVSIFILPATGNSSEATYPSVVPSVGVAVELGLVSCTPKVYPQGVG
jgi:hypothetical protein